MVHVCVCGMHVGAGECGFDPHLGPPAQCSKQGWCEDRGRSPLEAEPELLVQVVYVGGDPREPGRTERLKEGRGDSPQMGTIMASMGSDFGELCGKCLSCSCRAESLFTSPVLPGGSCMMAGQARQLKRNS